MAIKSHNRYYALPFINGEQYTNRYMTLSAHASKTAAVRELSHELMETCATPVKHFEVRVYDRATGTTDIYAPADDNGKRAHRQQQDIARLLNKAIIK